MGRNACISTFTVVLRSTLIMRGTIILMWHIQTCVCGQPVLEDILMT